MSFTNPTYDNLAQAAHAFAGYAVVLTAARLGRAPLIVVAPLFVVYAALKEFWFDIRYEKPEVSGGFPGGVRDFSFYMVGLVAGLIVVFAL
jgi:hypothetical protein